MDEFLKYQEFITDSMRKENEKYKELEAAHNYDQIITNAKDYHEKLVNIKRSMLIMRDKTAKLRKRAIKIMENKNREDIERQRSRERQEMLEKHLEPVVNTKRD